jgi:hypothetical protein
MKKWTEKELDFLKTNYPERGRLWCAEQLSRGEGSIRQKASELKLTINQSSPFFKEWQSRAAKTKIGKKRPDQALVLKNLHDQGKLEKTEQQKLKISKSIKLWHQENQHPRGMLGKKHSEQVKKIISEKSTNIAKEMSLEKRIGITLKAMKTKEKNGTMSLPRQKTTWKSGWREIGGSKKFYRSRWEANYARYLQWLKETSRIKDWKHECKTFWFDGVKRGTVSYLPDFWVQEIDESESYHEVKGWMDDKSKTKIKRMAKYHPDVKLIVITGKEYKVLESSLSSIIPEWES